MQRGKKAVEKRNEYTDDFFKALLTLKNIDECYLYFGDVCTKKEVDTMAQRLAVAIKLRQNKVYSDIVKETGASTATISRVKRSLDSSPGYDMALERMGIK